MSTALTIQNFDREKIELIKATVAKGTTDLELEWFLYQCNKTGLDPLVKQAHAVKRWSQADQKEVMTFQTGIDGLRLIADRTKKYAGSSDAIFEEKDGKPIVAHVTVLKIVDGEKCAFTASARYEEYVQKNRQMQPTSMWAKMPYLMLAKCAEAQALRKAFPMETSAVHVDEEMMHLDSEWKESLQRSPQQIAAEQEKRAEAAPAIDEAVCPAPADASGLVASAPSTSVFDESSAVAEHQAAINECQTDKEYEQARLDVTNDKRLTNETRSPLYAEILRKAKALRLKK